MAHTKKPSSTFASRIKSQKFKGFTLIELIVVITILAILGTIGFLSIGGYSSKARDSSRISDVANISKSLDVSIITVGTYPTPDNSFAVTYSWGTIWNQGTISTNVLQALRTSIAGGGLSKKPVDPLDNSEYVYSSLAFGKSYQIQAKYENNIDSTALTLPNLTQEAFAAPGAPTISYIKGNFGGLMARTVTGSYTYVLALPSIITNTGSTSTPKIEIANTNTLSGALLFHGRTLKAASTFNPSSISPVYTSTGGLPTTTSQVELLMTNLKTAYSGTGTPTDIKSNTTIASLLTMNTGSLTTLGTNLVKNDLGGVGVGGGGQQEGTTTVSGPCTSLPSNAVYFNSTTSYSVTSASSGTTLVATTAGYSASPTTNTCQYKCGVGTVWNGSMCNGMLARWRVSSYNANTDYLAYVTPNSFTFDTNLANYESACAAYGKVMYRNDGSNTSNGCGWIFVNSWKAAYGGCWNSTFNNNTSSKTYINGSALIWKSVAWIYYNISGGQLYGAKMTCNTVGSNNDGGAICDGSWSPLNGNWQWTTMTVNAGDIILCQDS